MRQVKQFLLFFTLFVLFGCDTIVAQSETIEVVGKVGILPIGTSLADKINGKHVFITDGNRVLVLETGADGWRRVLASDGSYGWTNVVIEFLSLVSISGKIEASDYAPGDVSKQASQIVALEASAKITGASKKPGVALLQHMLMPDEKNWLQTPFLRLESNGKVGWISPYEVDLNFTDKNDSKLRGIIRKPFFDTKKYSDILQPRLGDSVLLAVGNGGDAKPETLSGDQWILNTLVFFPEKRMLLGHNQGFLIVDEAGRRIHLLFDDYQPFIQRAEFVDLDHDGEIEWLVEIAQLTGDGYITTLWVISTANSGIKAYPLMLGASSGELYGGRVVGSWWFDREQKKLWLVRAGGPRMSVKTVTFSKQDGVKESGEGEKTFLAIKEGYLFAINGAGGKLKWVRGRAFTSAQEAKAAMPTARLLVFP